MLESFPYAGERKEEEDREYVRYPHSPLSRTNRVRF